MRARVFGVVGLVILLFWGRPAKATEKASDPKISPVEPAIKPPARPGEKGSDPLDKPEQGMFYRVKDGDSLSRIAQLAGLGGTAWRAIRDHAENSWLPRQYPDGRFFAGTNEAALPLYRWFPEPGYKVEVRWKTEPKNVFPSIYIPKAEP